MSEKLGAGAPVPAITLGKVGGGTVTIGGARGGWQLVGTGALLRRRG